MSIYFLTQLVDLLFSFAKEILSRIVISVEGVRSEPKLPEGVRSQEQFMARLEEIAASQSDPNASKQQHIAAYRENVKILDSVKEDIERLEKMLTAVGGPPAPELLEKTEINLKSPNTRTTWVIIFVVLIFVGILSLTFYFTWHRQASITENIFSKEKDSSFKEFKGGGDKEKKE